MRRSRGRPRKFAAPSRAVTLTLPEWALSALSEMHEDISKAVVQLMQQRPRQRARPLAELSIFGKDLRQARALAAAVLRDPPRVA